jgi:hypothetical protein
MKSKLLSGNKALWFFGFLILVLVSCKSTTEKQNISDFHEFMYPEHAEPYIYVYQDSLNPFYEMFERVITRNFGGQKQMLIERYNYNFQLVEAYLLAYDNHFKVLNHALYNGPSEIPTTVTDSVFMPYDGRGVFATSFPGTNDSIMFSMKNVRNRIEKQGVFEWEGETFTTIQFSDSIYTLAADIKNRLEQEQNAVAIHHFAKGMGRVMITMSDDSSILILKRILTEAQWKKIITKD